MAFKVISSKKLNCGREGKWEVLMMQTKKAIQQRF